ncbi:MAG: DUF3253 domain-containing protein [Tateyamaria sp.]|uniref:DUF3253 domain-containing protein n=1 Tax=Tateyamaria sp. TaxID=1929288 RepID=UPI00329EE837
MTTRGVGRAICPSEVARAIAAEWRALMPDVRRFGQGLADAGHIDATQRRRSANALEAKGPIRFGLPVSSDRKYHGESRKRRGRAPKICRRVSGLRIAACCIGCFL